MRTIDWRRTSGRNWRVVIDDRTEERKSRDLWYGQMAAQAVRPLDMSLFGQANDWRAEQNAADWAPTAYNDARNA